MRRSFTTFCTTAILAILAIGLVGCDSSPTSVEDFDIQGTMDSPSGITVSPDIAPEFTVSYQGLEESPTASFAESGGDFNLEKMSDEGDPKQGGTSRWKVTLAASQIQEAIKIASLVVKGTDQASGRTITDTLATVATTKLFAATDFTSSFVTFADYEGDIDSTTYVNDADNTLLDNTDPYPGNERSYQTSGAGYTLNNPDPAGFGLPANTNNTPAGSNGVRSLTISNSSAGGALTIRRRMNLPNSDAFFFLVKPPSRQVTLTLEFTEVTDGTDGSGGNATTATRSFAVPLTPGTGWLKLGIPFSEIDSDFNPVAPRSGGNGPLMSITFKVDAPVSYSVDELLFGTLANGEALPRAEFHDFETTTNAYGPPFCGGTYGFTSDVPTGSDGFTGRRVTGANCLGYNYGGGLGPPPMIFVDADANDVLSFYGKGVGQEDTVSPFIETANGDGGFSGGNAVSTTLPQDQWQKFEIPLSQLGSDPSALLNPGIRNIGFGGCDDCAIDDVKIVPKQ